jgi:hypothetical protein
MNAIETKVNYFRSKLDDIRRTEMDLKMKVGKYDEEFKLWLREQGLPENYSLLDLIDLFVKKKSSLVLP